MHLNKKQYASSFHFFSASINLKADFAASYMYLAITLARLDDFDNACAAYDKSIQIDGKDYTSRLNYAITLYSNEEYERSEEQFKIFVKLLAAKEEEGEDVDEEITQQKDLLEDALERELS